MMRKNIIGVVGGALVLLALSAAWHFSSSARAAQTALSRLADQRVQLESQIRKEEAKLAEAQRRSSTATNSPDQPRGAPPALRGRGPVLSDDALLRNDPKLQTLYLESVRAQVRDRNAPFCRALGLSAEQAKNFDELTLQAQERAADLRWTAQAEGTNMADPAYRELQREATAQLESSTRALLGEAGYQQLQELKRAAPVSTVVGQLGGAMAQTPTPLSADQAAQLTQMFENASSAYQMGKQASLTSVDWDSALTQAQGIIAAPQLAALKTTVVSYQQSDAATKIMQIVARDLGSN